MRSSATKEEWRCPLIQFIACEMKIQIVILIFETLSPELGVDLMREFFMAERRNNLLDLEHERDEVGVFKRTVQFRQISSHGKGISVECERSDGSVVDREDALNGLNCRRWHRRLPRVRVDRDPKRRYRQRPKTRDGLVSSDAVL